MRLDKFIAENTGLTRSQATKAIRQSAVKINGEIVKNGATKVSQEDEIYFEYLSDSDMTGEKLEEKLYDANIWRE